MGRYTESLNIKLKQKHLDYERQLLQTYFTAPEWRNVEMAEEFGDFLGKGNPFYLYPYFKQVFTFWHVFIESYKEARKHHSFSEVAFSEYMLMNLFIGTFTTIEFGAKGLFSLFLRPILSNQNNTSFQTQVANLAKEYGQFIHKIPFYNFPYLSKMKPLWKHFKENGQTVADFISLIATTVELLTKALVSAPVAYWYNQPANQAAEKIHLLIKTSKTDNALSKKPLTAINDQIKVVAEFKHSERVYTHITVPRYEAFQQVVEDLIENDVKIQKIAGQNNIQFKLIVDEPSMKDLKDYQVLYAYQNNIEEKKNFVAIDVSTKDLSETVTNLKRKNIHIALMHDF